MLVDFHNHTTLCCHATGEMEEYIQAAIQKGIRILGFADHSPWMPQEDVKMAMSYEEVPVYIKQVEKWKEYYENRENYPIHIRLGMEMDFLPDQTDLPRDFCRKYDFDYVIGSVHHIGKWGFDQESQADLYEKKSVRAIYESYFDLVKQLIRSGLFDIVGHIDLVKKFGYFPEEGWEDIQEEMAEVLAESRMVVELNTSGRDKPVGEFYPGPSFLSRLIKRGVQITLGSDSHDPAHVGRYFDEAVALLKKLGCKEVMSFEKRKMAPVSLD